MKNLVELYCDVDDFCKVFIPQWQKQLIEDGTRKRLRQSRMSTSEIMTIIIGFHMSHAQYDCADVRLFFIVEGKTYRY